MGRADSTETEAIAGTGALERVTPALVWTDKAGAHKVALEGRATIGSADGVDVLVSDPSVSRLHAELELRADGTVAVRDLGSRNGTFVDRVRVESAYVPPGGVMRVGRTVITVEVGQRTRVPLWAEESFGLLRGKSVVMRELFARLAKVAATEVTVLLLGETGTGKEVAARSLHDASRRASGPFVVVDCAALPENLLETELFGHTRGAFTGAVAARAGAFEIGSGGTVFLDEIGELPLALQPKLLRVLESREVRRVGASAYEKVDVRFVSATHRDLREMVNAGAFREDLYFRVAVLPVTMPPLRAREGDVAMLVSHFLPTDAPAELAGELAREAEGRPWLGNVRELRNFVERAIALGASEAAAATDASIADERFPPIDVKTPFKEIRERWLDHLEREYVRILLERNDHNIPAVASAAGLDRTYVYRLVKKHDL